MTATSCRDKYRASLTSMPGAGLGENCHITLLSTANHGVRAGIDPETLFQDIRLSIPPGKRRVPDKEIANAIQRALADHKVGSFTPKAKAEPVVNDGHVVRQRIIDQGKFRDEIDLINSSPVRIDKAAGDPGLFKLFFENLFKPDDLLFIGDRLEPGIMGRNIRRAVDWLNDLYGGEKAGPYIIPNPLTGQSSPKKGGFGQTLRGDANVKEFRRCVVEFDDISREDQIAFWSAARLPVAALIDSGGKSIHAWLNINQLASVTSLDDWDVTIKQRLYQRMLIPLGVDAACSNAARLSRLPGHFRTEKGKYQRLLWLAGRTA